MGLQDQLANPGNAFQSSFLRAESNRRQTEAHGLRQQMNRQKIQQNDMQLNAMQRQTDIETERRSMIQQYQGDKRGLIDELSNSGDMEGAANVIKFESAIGKLGKADQDAARAKRTEIMKDTQDTALSVTEAYKRDPSGREGQLLAIQEGERLKQQYPDIAAQIPDFRGMRPDQADGWWQNKKNRSLANLRFEQDNAMGGGTDAYSRARARAMAPDATAEDISRFMTLSNTKARMPTEGTEDRFNQRMKLSKDKFGFAVNKQKTKRTEKLRSNANKDMKSLRYMKDQIDRLKSLIKQGGPVASKQIKAGLANLSGSKVRALAELQQYANFGTLPERIANGVSLFFSGDFSDTAMRQAYDFVTELQDNYVDPGLKDVRIYWRNQGREENLNPHSIARYDNIGDVKADFQSGLLNEDQARSIARDNPQWLPGK